MNLVSLCVPVSLVSILLERMRVGVVVKAPFGITEKNSFQWLVELEMRREENWFVS